jgi:hypothetical protein
MLTKKHALLQNHYLDTWKYIVTEIIMTTKTHEHHKLWLQNNIHENYKPKLSKLDSFPLW